MFYICNIFFIIFKIGMLCNIPISYRQISILVYNIISNIVFPFYFYISSSHDRSTVSFFEHITLPVDIIPFSVFFAIPLKRSNPFF